MNRKREALTLPRVDMDFSAFPVTEPASTRVFRAHSTGNSPWFFASDDGGRFNLREPRGTCYFADDAETAIRESFGPLVEDGGVITRARAESKRVSTVDLPDGATFADLGAGNTVRYGLIREVLTSVDYTITNAWAEALSQIPTDGIRYASRFTMGDSNSWALFGQAGADDTRAIAELGVLNGVEACESAGITVIDDSIGYDDEITFAQPPSTGVVTERLGIRGGSTRVRRTPR